MCNGAGKKVWILPDCELPKEGEGIAKGHESVIVVNDSDKDANISVKLFFVDKEPYEEIKWTVGKGKVRCFRTNKPSDMCGYEVPFETQYAIKLTSDTNIVVQYGRLDNTQANLSFYTTMGYSE